MVKFKNYKRISSIIFLSVIVLISSIVACRRDLGTERSSMIVNGKIAKAKSWFSNYISTFEPDKMFKGAIYRWDKARITKASNGSDIIVVPINTDKFITSYLGVRTLMLYPWKNGKGYFTNVLETIFDPNYYSTSKGHFDFSKFKGLMNVWSLKTGFSRGAYFANNEMPGICEIRSSKKRTLSTSKNQSFNALHGLSTRGYCVFFL